MPFFIQCSAECGRGMRTREVVCVNSEDKPLAENKCEGEKAKSSEICDMGSCAKTWFFTTWSDEVGDIVSLNLNGADPLTRQLLASKCVDQRQAMAICLDANNQRVCGSLLTLLNMRRSAHWPMMQICPLHWPTHVSKWF